MLIGIFLFFFAEKIEMELAREAANKAVEEKTVENKKLVYKMKEIVNI